MKPLAVAWLGRIAWDRALALQVALRRRILDGDETAETLLIVEHDPVITLGRAAQAEHVLAPPSLLAARGIQLVRASRGGEVTYHGPGQLVAYPVVRLAAGVVAHVEAMAQAVVAVAARVEVAAEFRRACPGIWVGDAKLAAVGVHVHRRVSIHGVALNVSTALDAFSLIVPCGLLGGRVTSLAVEAQRSLAVAELAAPFAEAFARAIGRAPVEAPDTGWPWPLLSGSAPVE
jgi:lipoyl(octanoyl) transferase